MPKHIVTIIIISFSLFFINCDSKPKLKNSERLDIDLKSKTEGLHLLTDIEPLTGDGNIRAVIEIPSGTVEKWELDKSTGEIKWEVVNRKPRVVDYIGYPGNYGMIPQTLLSKEKGGDGDPLDILVLGPPAERGQILKCKIIGVLNLMDNGEKDDKILAVSSNTPMHNLNSIEELNRDYNGVIEIIELWFTNYKGTGKVESRGYQDQEVALNILHTAIKEYQSTLVKPN